MEGAQPGRVGHKPRHAGVAPTRSDKDNAKQSLGSEAASRRLPKDDVSRLSRSLARGGMGEESDTAGTRCWYAQSLEKGVVVEGTRQAPQLYHRRLMGHRDNRIITRPVSGDDNASVCLIVLRWRFQGAMLLSQLGHQSTRDRWRQGNLVRCGHVLCAGTNAVGWKTAHEDRV